MRLLKDGAGDVRTQMERDAEFLARAGREVDFEATLRIFLFDPPGITLGRSQDPQRELDLDRCRRDGVEWAIRPTGGRAIFHEHEWTYSLTCRIEDPAWGGSRAEAYECCSALIARSLDRLGIEVEFGKGLRPRPDRPPVERGAAPPCFASTARHEITRGGRKLVGSAQRRTRHALLQQGSILLGSGHLRVADYLPLAEDEREAERSWLKACSTDAGERGRSLQLSHWMDALTLQIGMTEDEKARSAAGKRAIPT